MTKTVHAFRGPGHTGALRGDPDVVFDALRVANATAVYRWNRALMAYLIDLRRYNDVLAALAAAHIRVAWHNTTPEPESKADVAPVQLTLGGDE